MVLVLSVVVLAGCNKTKTRSEDVSTTSPTNPQQAAQTALASAKLTLPDSATGITIDLTGYEDFRNVALVRFVAPRSDVVSMCERAGAQPKRIFSLATYQEQLLGGPAAEGDQLCTTTSEQGRGISANVLIPANDPATVRVSVFQMPVR
jgi:hypothetical protein